MYIFFLIELIVYERRQVATLPSGQITHLFPFNNTADLINMSYNKFHKYISHEVKIMGDFNIIINDP